MSKPPQQTSARAGRIRQALRYRLNRVWLTKCWVAFCQDVEEFQPPAEGQPGIDFRRAEASELDSLAEMSQHMGPSARKILAEQFLCPQDITMIGTDTETGKLVYHTWLSHECTGLKLLGDWAHRPAASLRRAWVPPALRRKGIATVGFRILLSAAAEEGVRQIWSFVLPDNIPSMRLHQRLGFRQTGNIHLKARFGHKFLVGHCDGQQDERRVDVPGDFRTL